MKKCKSIIICSLVLLILMTANGCRATIKPDTSNIMENNSFFDDDNITFDKKSGRAKFDDGIISYSWDTNKWHFSLYNRKPQLESPWSKLQIKFTILADHNGVAEDFWEYAMSGLMKFYGESSNYVWTHMFASTTDPYFNEKGYFGERTGFYDMHLNKDSDSVKYNLAIVHVVTDGKKTAVVCISANGFKEDIIDLHEIIFPERGFTSVLEDITSDIVDTFTFHNDAPEDNDDKKKEGRSFGYRDAYNKFSEVYSWGSHAEYIEYVENEADKLKNEVFRTNYEIMEILKKKYDLISEEIGTNRTYNEYYQSFVAPYEKYYLDRMEAAENSRDVYLSLSSIVTYGGNSAGDCAVLWRYVHYHNLLNELIDLKTFLG